MTAALLNIGSRGGLLMGLYTFRLAKGVVL